MPRIRSIKPEFPQSETIGKLSRDARLLFIQLWTLADDSGRARASSRMLASLLYPYDDDARGLIDGWLDELNRENCIRLYEVDGSHYLDIVNWLKHQKIDHPSASKLPEFRDLSRGFAKTSEVIATDQDRIGEDKTLAQVVSLPHPPKRANGGESDWPSDFKDRFWEKYPRHIGKQSAFKALDRLRKSGKVPWERLIAGIGRSPQLRKSDPQFIPYPASWLNSGGYDDDHESESQPKFRPHLEGII